MNGIIVMGVSGSGKSSFGTALAHALGWVFLDADDVHSESNRQKMARGEALTDTDREPWLQALHLLLKQHLAAGQPLVLACSALKASYRQTLTNGLEGVLLVWLSGRPELIQERMAARTHFMPLGLLASQLAILEPPSNALRLDIEKPIQTLVQETLQHIQTKEQT